MGEPKEIDAGPESLGVTGSTFGKYHLFASLGRGGMADVFLAVARGPMGFNKLTVIKRLRADLASDPSHIGMLLDEARLAARLSHPNVVHTYEVGETHGNYFIAMEYLEGQPLVKLARTAEKIGEKLSPPLCARIIGDALSGLHYAHELRDYDSTPLNIIHRDVSPHNIFVTYDGVVKIMDFGIAKAASSASQTEVGVLKGKVAYMAPEQAISGTVDRRADLFAMGIVLWELITQKRLFTTGSAAATLHKLLSQPIPRLSEVDPSVDPRLDAIVAKALEKEPARRYQTAQEMRSALEEFITASGAIIRQEETGHRVSDMFEQTRKNVQRQIQSHMQELSLASSTGELMALNSDALRRLGSQLTPSGKSLLQLGHTGSGGEIGSGSGAIEIVHESAPGSRDASRARKTEQSGKKRGLLLPLLWALLGAGVVLLLLVRPWHREPPPPAPPSAPTAATTEPTAPLAPPTPAPVAPAPAAISATAVAAAPPAPEPAAPSRGEHGHHPAAPARPAAPTPAPANTATAATDTGTGYVTLDTYPWTRVSENGRILGVTPLVRVPLSAGSHVLTLENPDQGIKQSYPVTIAAGENVSRRLGLK